MFLELLSIEDYKTFLLLVTKHFTFGIRSPQTALIMQQFFVKGQVGNWSDSWLPNTPNMHTFFLKRSIEIYNSTKIFTPNFPADFPCSHAIYTNFELMCRNYMRGLAKVKKKYQRGTRYGVL